MAYAHYDYPQWRLYRINKNGFLEFITYLGPLKDKPKGWLLWNR